MNKKDILEVLGILVLCLILTIGGIFVMMLEVELFKIIMKFIEPYDPFTLEPLP